MSEYEELLKVSIKYMTEPVVWDRQNVPAGSGRFR